MPKYAFVPRPEVIVGLGEKTVVASHRTPNARNKAIEGAHIRALESADHEFPCQECVRRLVVHVGEDPEREGLLKTPASVQMAIEWLTSGYRKSVPDVVNGGVFGESYDNMILVRDMEVYSLCEHHMLPSVGKAHVAYISKGKVIGLSNPAESEW